MLVGEVEFAGPPVFLGFVMNATARAPAPDPLQTEASIECLVDEYQGRLLAYATRMLGDVNAAQDAVQETFLQLCRHRRRPDAEDLSGRMAPWLFTVCRTRVIDMQRKRTPDSFESIPVPIADPAAPPGNALAEAEDYQRIAESIGDLTPRQQEVLQLRMQAGLSYREIAEVTGLSVTNVGFHLHQAVKSLRQRLAVS